MTTTVADVITPERYDIFTRRAIMRTMEKNALIRSGALMLDSRIASFMAGGGRTFHMPFFNDLARVAANISTSHTADKFSHDVPGNDSAPQNISQSKITAVRIDRNQSWATSDLAHHLSGDDPFGAITELVGDYWDWELQRTVLSIMAGVFAQNAANENDMTLDISGDAATPGDFEDGITNITPSSFLDALQLMGDARNSLRMIYMHSQVATNLQKQGHYTRTIVDPNTEQQIGTYNGRMVIEDDSMPSPEAGVFETWVMAGGAVKVGAGSAEMPTEVQRQAQAGNGGGQTVLYNRIALGLGVNGYSYIGTPPYEGGPSNETTTGNLGSAGSWTRAYPELKQIGMVRIISREA